MAINEALLWTTLRGIAGRGLTQIEVDAVKAALGLPLPINDVAEEPKWLGEARQLIGQREIKGPQHNPFIVKLWKRLGAGWFVDDETPWCGGFAAHCMDVAGHKPPKDFPRAKSWAAWGQACGPVIGAVAVFGREGGGHVGFLVGQSATHYYVLGGNQGDAVCIMPIEKSRLINLRYPSGLPVPATLAPKMAGGKVSTNEA